MPATVQKLRLFLASPGDVTTERNAMESVVRELNLSLGAPLGFVLELVRWETHARPALGRPQGLVNDLLGAYDLFVGVMWKRFGTPTGLADSGTAEEFERAHAEWQRDATLPVLFYFSNAKYRIQTPDEATQVAKVLEFRSRLNKLGLMWSYPSASKFADTVRPHLAKLLCERMSTRPGAGEAVGAGAGSSASSVGAVDRGASGGSGLGRGRGAERGGMRDGAAESADRARPDARGFEIDELAAGRADGEPAKKPGTPRQPASSPSPAPASSPARTREPERPRDAHAAPPNPVLLARFEKLWPHLEPEAQEAFSLAFHASNGGVKTESLFAALRAVGDARLEPILERVGDDALPAPTVSSAEPDRAILDGEPWFSPCVADSITSLAKVAERGESISAADLFVDIAKHGTGSSVVRLRKHGIDARAIDEIARSLGVAVVERDERGATFELPMG